jgi:hypothetical protein
MVLLETQTTEINQRPEAVFFEPGIAEYYISEEYFRTRQDLFLSESGVVHSFVYPEETGRTTSILFDASRRDQEGYVWQYTKSNHGAREIWKLAVNEDHIDGYSFGVDSQGSLRSNTVIAEEDKSRIWNIITEILSTKDAVTYEARLWTAKQAAIDSKLEFEETGKTLIDIPNYADGTKKSERKLVTLESPKSEEHLKNLEESVRRVGFIASRPFKPTIEEAVAFPPIVAKVLAAVAANR